MSHKCHFCYRIKETFPSCTWVLTTDMFPFLLWPPVPDTALGRSAAQLPGRHQSERAHSGAAHLPRGQSAGLADSRCSESQHSLGALDAPGTVLRTPRESARRLLATALSGDAAVIPFYKKKKKMRLKEIKRHTPNHSANDETRI